MYKLYIGSKKTINNKLTERIFLRKHSVKDMSVITVRRYTGNI